LGQFGFCIFVLTEIKITTDKFKLLGIIIPTNGKQKDLIEENYYNKKNY
jgi:hypothetical protein